MLLKAGDSAAKKCPVIYSNVCCPRFENKKSKPAVTDNLFHLQETQEVQSFQAEQIFLYCNTK